eukprot:Clim_evm70s144 gene=Clim_evmTU70s144
MGEPSEKDCHYGSNPFGTRKYFAFCSQFWNHPSFVDLCEKFDDTFPNASIGRALGVDGFQVRYKDDLSSRSIIAAGLYAMTCFQPPWPITDLPVSVEEEEEEWSGPSQSAEHVICSTESQRQSRASSTQAATEVIGDDAAEAPAPTTSNIQRTLKFSPESADVMPLKRKIDFGETAEDPHSPRMLSLKRRMDSILSDDEDKANNSPGHGTHQHSEILTDSASKRRRDAKENVRDSVDFGRDESSFELRQANVSGHLLDQSDIPTEASLVDYLPTQHSNNPIPPNLRFQRTPFSENRILGNMQDVIAVPLESSGVKDVKNQRMIAIRSDPSQMLPGEVWTRIFTFLDYKTLKQVARTCRLFRALVWHPAQWDKRIFYIQDNHILTSAYLNRIFALGPEMLHAGYLVRHREDDRKAEGQGSAVSAGLKLVKDLVVYNVLGRPQSGLARTAEMAADGLKMIKHLDLHSHSMWRYVLGLLQYVDYLDLETLNVSTHTSSADVQRILNLSPKLRTLVVDNWGPDLVLPKSLVHLKITAQIRLDGRGWPPLPNLQTLHLDCRRFNRNNNVQGPVEIGSNSLSRLAEIPEHYPNLRHLDLTGLWSTLFVDDYMVPEQQNVLNMCKTLLQGLPELIFFNMNVPTPFYNSRTAFLDTVVRHPSLRTLVMNHGVFEFDDLGPVARFYIKLMRKAPHVYVARGLGLEQLLEFDHFMPEPYQFIRYHRMDGLRMQWQDPQTMPVDRNTGVDGSSFADHWLHRMYKLNATEPWSRVPLETRAQIDSFWVTMGEAYHDLIEWEHRRDDEPSYTMEYVCFDDDDEEQESVISGSESGSRPESEDEDRVEDDEDDEDDVD